jgi:hypothetical protein
VPRDPGVVGKMAEWYISRSPISAGVHITEISVLSGVHIKSLAVSYGVVGLPVAAQEGAFRHSRTCSTVTVLSAAGDATKWPVEGRRTARPCVLHGLRRSYAYSQGRRLCGETRAGPRGPRAQNAREHSRGPRRGASKLALAPDAAAKFWVAKTSSSTLRVAQLSLRSSWCIATVAGHL